MQQLEEGQTGDTIWDAMQHQLNTTGKQQLSPIFQVTKSGSSASVVLEKASEATLGWADACPATQMNPHALHCSCCSTSDTGMTNW